MKKEYIKPEVNVVIFKGKDILTVSGGIVLPDDEWSFRIGG